ncbi:MAG: ribonuclease III, partial [Chloroflexota bacterium]
MAETLEEELGIHFQDPSLLQLALTHRSYIYETPGEGRSSNERLEFLGDSILAFVSTDFLYRSFPDLTEGELTDVRAVLVKTETLADFAREIHLGNFLLMGKGEQSSGGGKRVLASAFEALLGAIYLDQGITAVQSFLIHRIEPIARNIVKKR